MKTPFTLEGKKILITGASSGIGRAIAILCSNMGACCILTARNKTNLEQTIALMSGEGHSIFPVDITYQKEVESLVESLPKLDGIVQNAGIGFNCPCKYVTKDEISKVFSVNTFAPIILQKLLLEKKKVNKGASIVFISSITHKKPLLGNSIYSASKAAILSYAKVLALELSPRQIRVNSVCPAMVWTDLLNSTGLEDEVLKQDEKNYPLGRYGTPEDVANLVGFLLSPASSWMTGTEVELTGGFC